jgi:hypothetical protein
MLAKLDRSAIGRSDRVSTYFSGILTHNEFRRPDSRPC